jgi:hypothetical protein
LHTTGWRLGVSGGISALLFKSALSAAVAPNRSLAAGIISSRLKKFLVLISFRHCHGYIMGKNIYEIFWTVKFVDIS